MSQTQLSDTDPDFVPAGKFGYCCMDPSCKMYVHTYVRCKTCGRPCPGCVKDRPEKRRRF